jgi:hypothetical protein
MVPREEGKQAPQHLRHAAITQEGPNEIHDSQEDNGYKESLAKRSVSVIETTCNSLRLTYHSVKQKSEHDK